MSDIIDETVEQNETEQSKVVQLFANGTGSEWVDVTLIKGEEQICPADDVLSAQLGLLKNVVLIGETANGGFMLASSLKRLADVNYLIEGARWHTTGFPLE